jgi:hypothetical protein
MRWLVYALTLWGAGLLGAADPPPPVYLEHVIMRLPVATVAAMRESDFVRTEFSAFEEKSTQRDGGAMGYSVIHLRGQHTYLEIFEPGANGPNGASLAAGNVSFGMWVDVRTQLPAIRDRLISETGFAAQITTTRNRQNNPSFDGVEGQPLETGAVFRSWVLSVYPNGNTREKQHASEYAPDRLFHDVSGITVAGTQRECAVLLKEFRAYGYQILKDGEKQVAIGPDVTFNLIPSESRTLTIHLALNREREGVYQLGDSELKLHGRTGAWVFHLPSR